MTEETSTVYGGGGGEQYDRGGYSRGGTRCSAPYTRTRTSIEPLDLRNALRVCWPSLYRVARHDGDAWRRGAVERSSAVVAVVVGDTIAVAVAAVVTGAATDRVW